MINLRNLLLAYIAYQAYQLAVAPRTSSSRSGLRQQQPENDNIAQVSKIRDTEQHHHQQQQHHQQFSDADNYKAPPARGSGGGTTGGTADDHVAAAKEALTEQQQDHDALHQHAKDHGVTDDNTAAAAAGNGKESLPLHQQQPLQQSEVGLDGQAQAVLEQHGSGPIPKVGYVLDLVSERASANVAAAEDEAQQDQLEKHVSQLTPSKQNVRSCYDESSKKVQQCMDKEIPVIVYNGASFDRHYCGKTVKADSVLTLEDEQCDDQGGDDDSFNIWHVFNNNEIALYSSAEAFSAGSDVDPIIVQSKDPTTDGLVASDKLQSIKNCPAPCHYEQDIPSNHHFRYVVGSPWKILQTADDPSKNNLAKVERTGTTVLTLVGDVLVHLFANFFVPTGSFGPVNSCRISLNSGTFRFPTHFFNSFPQHFDETCFIQPCHFKLPFRLPILILRSILFQRMYKRRSTLIKARHGGHT